MRSRPPTAAEARLVVWLLLFNATLATPMHGQELEEPVIERFPVKGSRYARFQGRIHAEGSPAELVALFYRDESLTEWLHKCEAAEVLAESGPGDRLYYFRYDAPLNKQEIVARAVMERSADGRYVDIDLDLLAEDDPLLAGVAPTVDRRGVRVRSMTARWSFAAVSPEQVEITYTVHLVPGGLVAPWPANIATRASVRKTLIKMKRLVEGRTLDLSDRSFLDGLPAREEESR